MIDRAPPVDTRLPSVPFPPSLPLSPNRPRLAWIDGLRGLAALYVALFHVWKLGTRDGPLPGLLEPLFGWMAFGSYAVPVFIVVSGYCLMLPVLADGGRLRGGSRGYLLRRARRILPAYYAALISSILLIWLGGLVKPRLAAGGAGISGSGMGGASDAAMLMGATPDLEPGSILSHLFLVHNLREGWTFTLNAPLWSIALEWQIYFFFPFVLLPIWRRSGMVTTLLVAFGLGFLPHLLLPAGRNFDWTTPWYLGLFALGMAAASRGEGRVMIPGSIAASSGIDRYLKRPLELRPLVFLGTFSYSLYLVHAPLLASTNTVLRATGFPPGPRFVTMLALVLPVCVLVAFCFHRVFERPFMKSRAGESNRLE